MLPQLLCFRRTRTFWSVKKAMCFIICLSADSVDLADSVDWVDETTNITNYSILTVIRASSLKFYSMDRPISTILLLLAHLLSIGDLNERENEAQLIFELFKTYRVHFFVLTMTTYYCTRQIYFLYKTNIFLLEKIVYIIYWLGFIVLQMSLLPPLNMHWFSNFWPFWKPYE